jgi:hypothetical protein
MSAPYRMNGVWTGTAFPLDVVNTRHPLSKERDIINPREKMVTTSFKE